MRIQAILILAALLGFAALAYGADEAPQPAQTEKKESAAPASEEAKPAAEAAKPDAAVEKPGGKNPKFPLASEWFVHIADTQPDDKNVGDVDEAQQLEQHVLEDLLVALQNSSDEHLKKSVTPDSTFRNMMKEAEKFRGHVVQLRGLLEVSERFPIPENKSGVAELYRGQISNISGQIFSFLSIERPNPELLKHPVRLTGTFMKRYAYKNRLAGEKLTWTPLVIVKTVEQFSEADVSPGNSPMSKTTGMIIALVVLMLFGRMAYGYTREKSKVSRDNPFTAIKRNIASRKSKPGKK